MCAQGRELAWSILLTWPRHKRLPSAVSASPTTRDGAKQRRGPMTTSARACGGNLSRYHSVFENYVCRVCINLVGLRRLQGGWHGGVIGGRSGNRSFEEMCVCVGHSQFPILAQRTYIADVPIHPCIGTVCRTEPRRQFRRGPGPNSDRTGTKVKQPGTKCRRATMPVLRDIICPVCQLSCFMASFWTHRLSASWWTE